MTDTELSKITNISLSTLNGYKNSNSDKMLLYHVLKEIPNLSSIYDKVIKDNKFLVKRYPKLMDELYDELSNVSEYEKYDFEKNVHVEYTITENGKDISKMTKYDFCATNGKDKIIIFKVRQVLLYGKKLEAVIERMYQSAKDEYKSIEICFLTLNPGKRAIESECDVSIKSIGKILSISDDKLIII